jgi:GT2 family glycosyltransferase
MTPRLSVVVVNFNGGMHVENCLASLALHPPLCPHEIVVVDNGSADGSVEKLRGRQGIRLIELGKNAGFSAANNVGLKATTGELALLLNNDTVVTPGALDVLVAKLDRDHAAAVVGPRLVDGQGRPELSFGPMISPLAELRQKLLTTGYSRDVAVVSRWIARATSREHYVDWVSGACLMVRRQAAEAAGLLDERFFLYTEDVDFCASIRALGWRVLYTPDAEIVHLRGRSRATVPGAMNAAYRQSHLAFYAKHHPRWFPVLRAYLRLRGQL